MLQVACGTLHAARRMERCMLQVACRTLQEFDAVLGSDIVFALELVPPLVRVVHALLSHPVRRCRGPRRRHAAVPQVVCRALRVAWWPLRGARGPLRGA